jgi:NADH:ubiquinone oxidoreductase subunit 5 (subunit L)/multisubunit Na+/H+ antiporter MnhA subunit
MLDAVTTLALAVAVGAPVIGGLISAQGAGRSGRAAVMGTGVGVVAAVTVLVASAADRPATWGSADRPLVEADRLGALLLVFVLLAALVVQSYAVRALRGDLFRHRFFVSSAAAASATALMVVAADLWMLALAWVAVSWATAALLRHDGRPAARAASRRAFASFAIGDLALLGATIAASVSAGAVTVRPDELAAIVQSEDAAGPFALATVLAVGVVAAALTRSAIPPAQSWLPMSVAAPTPSSAVLHAGIVNGGGVLLVRFAPVLAASRVATGAAVLGGCAGVLLGGAVARTRPDVKTALAWSTVAQMGFMVVQCVTGLLGPALVHMVAHGMYKANLFLGAGSTLAHTHPAAPDDRPLAPRAAIVAAVTTLAVGTAWVVVRPSSFGGVAGLVFAGYVAATVAHATWSWLRSRPVRSRLDLLAGVALVLATVAAVGLAAAIKAWLGTTIPEVDVALAAPGAILLALTGLVAVALPLAARRARGPLAGLSDRAYLWAAHLGDPARLAPVMARQEVRP